MGVRTFLHMLVGVEVDMSPYFEDFEKPSCKEGSYVKWSRLGGEPLPPLLKQAVLKCLREDFGDHLPEEDLLRENVECPYDLDYLTDTLENGLVFLGDTQGPLEKYYLGEPLIKDVMTADGYEIHPYSGEQDIQSLMDSRKSVFKKVQDMGLVGGYSEDDVMLVTISIGS